MRLDARVDAIAIEFSVYHAELMRMLTHVVWVDDETAQYGECDGPCGGALRAVQAKRIVIVISMRLIIVNPVGDDLDLEISEATVEAIKEHMAELKS